MKPTFVKRYRNRVLLPGALLLLVTLLLAVAGLMSARSEVDELAMEGQSYEAFRAIGRGLDQVALAQETLGICEKCEEIANSPTPDRQWLNTHIGYKLHDLYNVHESFILNGEDKPVYAIIGREPAQPQSFAKVAAAVQPHIELVRGRMHRAANYNERLPGAPLPERSSVRTSPLAIHSTDLAEIDGEPAIVSVMQMEHVGETGRAANVAPPLLVSLRFLDGAFLREVARQNFIAEPRIGRQDQLAGDERSLPIMTSQGRLLTYLVWKPLLPGPTLVHSLLPAAAIAFTLVAILLLALSLAMRKLMEKDEQQMTQLEQAHIELKASEAQAHHLAYHDVLTGLPNRAQFNHRFEEALDEMGPEDKLALLLVDLDRFKHVNDRFGHLAGDALIREVGKRLQRVVGKPEAVARIGGDEFAILLCNPGSAEAIEETLARIQNAMRQTIEVLGNQAHVGVSIGVAIAPDYGTDRTELMRRADIALYRTKADGRDGYQFFTEAMDETVQMRAVLEGELRKAIETGKGLSVHYQPQIDSFSGETVGLEALARWTHPLHGTIPPRIFISIAEETGLIARLGEWVLKQACAMARERPDLLVAVNLSPIQFRNEGFARRISSLVREARVDPHQIELEVTEGVLLDDKPQVRTMLRQLRREGFTIALDDFGTGYSSLSYLRKFKVDKIKIDKSFITSLNQAPDARAIVTAVITLGHAMGLRVNAEGVEDPEQERFLRQAGCDEMQGFLFSSAVPASRLPARRAESRRKVA